MIPFEEAVKRVMAHVPEPRQQQLSLHDTLGRVLAEDIRARRDHPPWDNTAVDGYAVRATDTGGASEATPVTLKVVETLPAGKMPAVPVGKGQATRIMTGAPMPDGADAVVMVEDTRDGGGTVDILCPARPGENIRPQGEDVREGQVVLTAGTRVRAPELGMLASLGRFQIRVNRRPRVGILSTGDEVAEIDEPRRVEKILNVNSHALAAQVREANAVPLVLGIARDTPEAVREGIRAGLSCDVLLISGGVSMGDYDYVKDVMSELGGGLDFWKVRIKPARPLAFGMISGVPVFGLPGNPVSSMVSFELFVRPFLLAAMGRRDTSRTVVHARLTEPVRKKAGRRFFLRAVVDKEGPEFVCRTTGPQGSGMLTSMVLANGLMDLPEETDGVLQPGETVTVRLI